MAGRGCLMLDQRVLCLDLVSFWDCAGIVQVGVCSKVIPFTNSDYGVGDFDTSWGWCIYRAQRFHGDGGRNVSLLLAWLIACGCCLGTGA